MNLQAQAAAIAEDVSPKVGFDPISIITILLPLLAQCFKQQASSQSPREYLQDHYDEDGTFDQSLLNRCRPQARRAMRQDGQRRLARHELDQISHASLYRAMTEDEAVVSAVMAEV